MVVFIHNKKLLTDLTHLVYQVARHELLQARKWHKKIFKIPVNKKSNYRLVGSNNELIGEFFLHSQLVVLFSYLALEYFALSCTRGLEKTTEWKKRRLDEKLKKLIPGEINLDPLPDILCDRFGDLEHRRHALNHPEFKNIAHGHDTEWDPAHLAWLMAGRYEDAYSTTIKIHDYLNASYKKHMAVINKNTGPVTLQIKERGARFKNPAKKKP